MRKINFYSILVSFCLPSILFSQTDEQLTRVIKNTNTKELNALKEQFRAEYIERTLRIEEYLRVCNACSRKEVIENGKTKEIYDVKDGVVYYNETSNFNGAKTSRADRLYNGGALGLNIQGQGMKARVWDGGGARTTHVEFPSSKVAIMDGAALNDHATHVTGTIVAQGITSNLRGVAFDGMVDSYDWNDDYTEMAAEAANGMLLSNHSYIISASTTLPWLYGAYDYRARQFDQIAFAAPYYLAVSSAGNDRNNFGDPNALAYLTEKGGYNLIKGMHNAKNFLVVGAVNQVLNYTSPTSVTMSDFSSWGPTDDGRIKPDLVTKGVSVRSTISTSDTAVAVYQGTSMASPGVSGVCLLMQQLYYDTNEDYMKAASLKGLLLHTTDEAGSFDGPDYEFGWGLVNAQKAAQLILDEESSLSIIDELTLNNSTTYTLPIYATGTAPLVASISWTDRAHATQNNGVNDPSTLYLVNDLDVRLEKDGVTYYPWTLNPAAPYDGAVQTQDNFRYNYEQVKISTPSAGLYTLTVTHKGTITGGTQDYSLVISGINQLLNSKSNDLNNKVIIYPNPVADKIYFNVATDLENFDVKIFDIYGKKIIDKQINKNNSIDINNFANGVYIVEVIIDNQKLIKKLIKK